MSKTSPGNPTATPVHGVYGLGSHTLIGMLLAVFFFVLLPVIPSPSKFHGDERFYTDAAMQMVKTGDYWTPRYADGRIRLLKPILTYWTTAGSFQILGINLFAARLPFLLAGVLVIYLTYQLARTVMKSAHVALFAALIMTTNVELMTISTRATPDVLTCLFVLMSMWGFARIWFQKDRTFAGPLLAFAGMGLAVQTKGLLGLCPLAANVLFWLVARPGGSCAKHFLNWPAIITGICIGMFWYVIMLQRHGLGAMHDFYADQVGAKISLSPWFVFVNVVTYLFAGVRYFLPWTLLLLAAMIRWRPALVAFWKQNRNECLFLISLFVVLVVIFGLGNMRRPRYLAASYPMLSVLLAAVLSNMGPLQVSPAWLNRSIKAVAVFISITGAGLLAGGIGTDWRLITGGSVLVVLGIAGWPATRSLNAMTRWMWVAGVSVVTFGVFGACIRPVFSPSPMAQAAEILATTSAANTTVFTWQITDSAAGQLRILSGGTLAIKALDTTTETPDFSGADIVITTPPNRLSLERAGYDLSEVAGTNKVLAASWLGQLMAKPLIKSHTRINPSYWIAVRSPL